LRCEASEVIEKLETENQEKRSLKVSLCFAAKICRAFSVADFVKDV